MQVRRAGLLVAVCALALACAHAQNAPSNSTSSAGDDVPFCDEVDTHPASNGASPGETGGGGDDDVGLGQGGVGTDEGGDSGDPNDVLPNAQHHAAEVGEVVKEVEESGVAVGVSEFGDAVSSKLQLATTVGSRMRERQAQIDQLHGETLPWLEQSVVSRRERSRVLRDEIRALNAKLRVLVDSLDRSSYVREQQSFMNIIDGLMRIQNAIEMRSMSSGQSTAPRAAATHPTHHNALLSVAHSVREVMPALTGGKAAESSEMLDLMHALDLLEVESTQSKASLPYQRRASLLTKRVLALLSSLIDKFNDIRQKHKEFAKANREMWSKEIETLQKQTDEITSTLSSVLEQAEYYLGEYMAHKQYLEFLTTEQQRALEQQREATERVRAMGDHFNQLSQVRASQLQKLQQVKHILTYGNAPFTPEVFDFACDGVVGGSAVVDACGVCGGGNATCQDCARVPNGPKRIDACGVCGGFGESCQYFCDGQPNSGKIVDLCGKCGGNSTLCMGCDGIPNSGVSLDDCGVCGGDGTSCAPAGSDAHAPLLTPKAGEAGVLLKIALPTPLTEEWASKHTPTLRAALGAVCGVHASRVQVLSIDGSSSINAVLGVIVGVQGGQAMVDTMRTALDNGTLVSALRSRGVMVSGVVVVEGPSVVLPALSQPFHASNSTTRARH